MSSHRVIQPIRRILLFFHRNLIAAQPAQVLNPGQEQPGRKPRIKAISILLALLIGTCLTGCAVHYFDKDTNTEHLWGIGHLKMRAVPQQGDKPPFTNAVIAFATGSQIVGLNLAAGQDFAGIAAGWDSRSRLVITSEDSQFYLLWPSNSICLPTAVKDLFSVRVGPEFPFNNSTNDWKPNQPKP